jgi:H+/Cl- antiporter ClcA
VPEPSFTDQLSTKALDTIDTVVATVNDKAVRPVIVAARAVVFGIIIGVVGLAALILLSIGFLRLVNDYVTGHHVWIAYLALGAIFSGAGAFLYSRRGSTSPDNG